LRLKVYSSQHPGKAQNILPRLHQQQIENIRVARMERLGYCIYHLDVVDERVDREKAQSAKSVKGKVWSGRPEGGLSPQGLRLVAAGINTRTS